MMKHFTSWLIFPVVLSVSACCGGKEEKSRWDANNPNKPISATATAKPTEAPATKPTTPPPSKNDDKKDEQARCKKPGAGAMNKVFPDDNTDGFKRVFKTDKDDLAEAEYSKGGDKITLSIKFDPDKKGEYAGVSDKVAGFPYKPFGKNKSNIFAKDCYLMSASSQQIAEDTRKAWIGKFNFSALP